MSVNIHFSLFLIPKLYIYIYVHPFQCNTVWFWFSVIALLLCAGVNPQRQPDISCLCEWVCTLFLADDRHNRCVVSWWMTWFTYTYVHWTISKTKALWEGFRKSVSDFRTQVCESGPSSLKNCKLYWESSNNQLILTPVWYNCTKIISLGTWFW